MNKADAAAPASRMRNTVLLGAAAFLLILAVVSDPESAFQASMQGLKLWWNIVFPALLPFLVLVEILTAYGWAHGIGVLMEPVMKKVFKLPASGGWALITGMTAGYPAGAHTAARMHAQGEIGLREAGHLASLSHFCNPVTIVIVIGTGLLHQPSAGYVLLIVHWLAGGLAAWTLGLFRREDAGPARPGDDQRSRLMRAAAKDSAQPARPLLKRAAAAAVAARERDGRSFGRLLGDSVTASVQTLMMIGGYILIFAVLAHVLGRYLLPYLPDYAASGLLEMHLGANDIRLSTGASGTLQLALLSAILGWSGISAHLQSLSLLKGSGGLWKRFVLQRLVHSLYAFMLMLAFAIPVGKFISPIWPAFRTEPYDAGPEFVFSLWKDWPGLLQAQAAMVVTLVILFGMISRFISRRR
ncbi:MULTISPECIES: nucleoside recognition domain-containing protein [Paenibacillus]|uniref:Nucleoside recognition protein n=1 Tax=Paenibacillus campinasensis TaxID=66347 RepID=A0A268ERM5_9BACL|nr:MULTISPECIES: nucleoside recognition domain-containing protein [Paenibacillus]PAD75741.1 nucleoside recognition protein [Paenibacillus campinasensis]PAK54558.1 nucleoside recognition protein [Paenibacillus sp. 7541]